MLQKYGLGKLIVHVVDRPRGGIRWMTDFVAAGGEGSGYASAFMRGLLNAAEDLDLIPFPQPLPLRGKCIAAALM